VSRRVSLQVLLSGFVGPTPLLDCRVHLSPQLSIHSLPRPRKVRERSARTDGSLDHIAEGFPLTLRLGK